MSGARRRPPAARLLRFDRALGVRRVAGVDEAGRGCLAGPLVAAAVCVDLARLDRAAVRALSRLDDSKRLREGVREELAAEILRRADQVVVVSDCPPTIDRRGLHRTNLDAMRRALAAIDPRADVCLVDGFALGAGAPEHRRVVGGDARSFAIAAASVIAKTTRDRLMRGPMASAHPQYGFDVHVGYATAAHRRALRAHGPASIHRMSFRSEAYGAPAPHTGALGAPSAAPPA